jgi:hypothetical protein
LLEIYPARVVKEDGREIIVNTLMAHPRTQYKNLPKYFNKYVSKDIFKDLIILGVPYFKLNSKRLFEEMELITKEGHTIYTEKAFKY